MANSHFIRRADPASEVNPIHDVVLLQIVTVYDQLVERGFTEQALGIPRTPDDPDNLILYLEFITEGDSVRIGFEALDKTLTPEQVNAYLAKALAFMKRSLDLLIFSGKAHYQNGGEAPGTASS